MHDLCVFPRRLSPFMFISLFVFSDLIYPRCTKGLETDCGSTSWAFSLFITWNLLSMVCAFRPLGYLLCLTESCFQYIFANMFTGTIILLSLSL